MVEKFGPCVATSVLQMVHIGINSTWFAIVAVVACGCGGNVATVPLYETSGKVTVQGQPADGAKVVFYPTSSELQGPRMPIPAGMADATGTFQLQSYEPQDGAPAGEFKVTVIWPEPIPPNVDQEMYQPKDRLQGRYSDPQRTTIKATIPEGGGEIPPFQLH
jgi:hypothetical protein